VGLLRACGVQERADACEASSRRMADELDVAKAKAAELGKMEATLDKYKQKLDQAASARQHIKELEEQNAKYLDQVRAPLCFIQFEEEEELEHG
jgi:protein HOOK3